MKATKRRRVALAGTGHRGAGTWGKELIACCGELVELVGLCDANALRLARAREAIGTGAPGFTDLRAMLDPHTAAELSLDQIHEMVDDLIVAHEDWIPALA